MIHGERRIRGRLRRKYGLVLGIAIVGALLISGLVDLYFTYRDQAAAITRLEEQQARAAGAVFQGFLKDVERQVRWANPKPGITGSDAFDQRYEGYVRLLQQMPAIYEVMYLDGDGRQQLMISRERPTVVGSGADYSLSTAFGMAQNHGTYFGTVDFYWGSEPFMTVAVPEEGPDGGVTVAEVNLKLIWDTVADTRVGERGYAYVVDAGGYLIAHPDLSLVLTKKNLSDRPYVAAALGGADSLREGVDAIFPNLRGEPVLVAYHRIDPPGWFVFVDRPLEEAFSPLQNALVRAGLVLAWGVALAVIASLVLAHRMVTPIRALQTSAAQIGAGALDQRVEVRTGDELEALAEEFNHMADQVRDAHANLEQEVAERTEELEEKSHLLEIASQNKTAFLANTSHELRTPLNAIIGFSEVLAEGRYGSLNEKQEEYLDDVLTSARHLKSLINDLLDLARIEDGRMELEVGAFSLVALLQGGITIVREAAQRGRVTLSLEVAPGLDVIEADERKVKHIVFNLLSNAVKFTPAGGRVTVSAAVMDDEVRVAVRDTGIGIAPEDQARIFEPFLRVRRREVQSREGTGLGLALARRYVELHGGRIGVESVVGAGSTFTFTLPRARIIPPDEDDLLPETEVLVDASLTPIGPKVVVVDDDPQALDLVRAVLSPQGYQVLPAANGREGLTIIRRERPGLVVLDLLMPEMDGYAVLQALRDDPSTTDIPVVVLTAETVGRDDRARLEGRISQLLRKGEFSWPGFVSVVRSHYSAQVA